MDGKPRELPWFFHPTRITIGGSEAAGAMVGNCAIIAGFALLVWVVVQLLKKLFPKLMERLDTVDPEGLLRFPSAPLFVFQWLYQGTSLTGIMLLFYPSVPVHVLLGLVVCVVCFGVPFFVVWQLRRSVPRHAFYKLDERKRGRFFDTVVGPGEWVSVARDHHFVQKYASVMRAYQEHYCWFAFIDFAASFGLASTSALRAEDFVGCGHIRMAQAVLFFALLGVEARYWPHHRSRDSVTDFITNGMQGAACVCMGVGFYAEDLSHGGFKVSDMLLLGSTYVLMAKVTVDVLTEVYVFLSKRRTVMQEEVWSSRESEALKELCVVSPDSSVATEACDTILPPSMSAGTLRSASRSGVMVANESSSKSRGSRMSASFPWGRTGYWPCSLQTCGRRNG